MAWDPKMRAKLKMLHERGVVAVLYHAEGCNVELELLNCVGPGAYDYSPYSVTETKFAEDANSLFAELPLGAARLGGKVGNGRALRTDYTLAGVFSIPPMATYPASKLTGDCSRATHVVSSLYVGGFAMHSGERESLAAGANLFGAGAEATTERRAERLHREGDSGACERAQREGQREEGCSVPLRLGLVPILKPQAATATAPSAGRPERAGQRCDERAPEACVDACNEGNAWSCQVLGTAYAKGAGVSQDFTRAAEFYEKACAGDYPRACHEVGRLYQDGRGVPQDLGRAQEFHQKACDGENAAACNHLGYVIAKRGGSAPKATSAFKKGCDLGDSAACGNLGRRLLVGEGVEKNRAEGLALLRLSCSYKVEWSCQRLREHGFLTAEEERDKALVAAAEDGCRRSSSDAHYLEVKNSLARVKTLRVGDKGLVSSSFTYFYSEPNFAGASRSIEFGTELRYEGVSGMEPAWCLAAVKVSVVRSSGKNGPAVGSVGWVDLQSTSWGAQKSGE